MAKHEKQTDGAGFAHFFSVGSRVLKRVSPLDRLIVNSDTVPHGWGHIRTVGDSYPPGVTFEGDPKGPRLPIPRLYKTVGIMAVEAAEVHEVSRSYPYRFEAVALKFGHALAIGAFAPGATFDRETEEDKELVGVRIGRGNVTAIPGFYIPLSDSFVPFESTTEYARVSLGSQDPRTPVV